jgi:hypothetical protein
VGVLSGCAPQPDGAGVMQLFDGGQYWGGWCKGERQGWGVWRSSSGDEYRGEFRRGKYCGFGVLREGAVSRFGRWVDGALVLQQRLAAAALVAARETAIYAGGEVCRTVVFLSQLSLARPYRVMRRNVFSR